MAYSSITNPGDYFNTVLYTGNGGTQSITGVGFQPDYVWLKERASDAVDHKNVDSVRGATKKLESNTNELEGTATTTVTSFDSDGFSLGSSGATNGSSDTYVSWNWLAGGTAPTQTYTVKVVSDSGNKYRFDDFGTSAVTLDLQEGGTYTFDQSDSSNSGHPLRFATAADAAGGTEYTTGVTTTGTPGSSGAQTVITVAASAPTLYYYCTNHSGMGGQANTNSLFGSSNFAGSYQSLVSANTTAGFSIVTYSGTGSNATVGHGLGVAPSWIMVKEKTGSVNDWAIYAKPIGIGMSSPDPETDYLILNETNARADSNTVWNDTAPTSTVFSIGTGSTTNRSGSTYVAYCFSEVKGYSKFGAYTGNGTNSNESPYAYTGFKPAFVIFKRTNGTGNWQLLDNKRTTSGGNHQNQTLYPNSNIGDQNEGDLDLLSNGFKLRSTGTDGNGSGDSYVYWAIAENPFAANDSGTAVPTTAR
mgnify:CR=1 FL=1